MSQDFYIGYEPKASKTTARFVALTACALVLLMMTWAVLWSGIMGDAGDGVYEFGQPTTYPGVLIDDVYPVAWIEDEHGPREVMLVSEYKHGADQHVDGWHGKHADIQGTRIERAQTMMLELVASPFIERAQIIEDSTFTAIPTASPALLLTAEGEIVDSKCWLGVMNPAEGIVHRACARLCVQGGIPPAFVFQDADGATHVALIYGPDGEAAGSQLLPLVARKITLEGQFSRASNGRLARFQLANWPDGAAN